MKFGTYSTEFGHSIDVSNLDKIGEIKAKLITTNNYTKEKQSIRTETLV